MAPDSLAAVVLVVALTALVATGTALFWDSRARIDGRHRWRAWIVRPLAILLCLLSAGGAAIVIANRELGFFGTWPELVGMGPGVAASGLDTVTRSKTGSRVVGFTVAGAASRLTLRAFAYLPPGYDDDAAQGVRLPVLEMLDGFPGSPHVWLSTLDAPHILDNEIASGRMAPTVVVFPYQSTSGARDTECVDAVGGLAVDTFLTTDVPAAVATLFSVRTDGASWGLLGYSTGGYCAVNLAMRHPGRYAAAASLSGNMTPYTDPATGDLFHGDTNIANLNNPLWRLKNLKPEPLAIYLGAGLNDHDSIQDIQRFVALARPPLRVTTAAIAATGHTMAAWRAFQAPAYDWMSSWLARPAPAT
jgi:enterochelin esterase-like enzyme